MLNFRISAEAKKRMAELTEEISVKFSIENVVPAVVFVDRKFNEEINKSFPAIGFYDKIDVMPCDLCYCEEFEYVLAISELDRDKFEGKILMFSEEGFSLIDQYASGQGRLAD